MTKTIIISDLHIKEIEKAFFKEKRKELIDTVVNSIVNDSNVEHVVLNGDTFNESRISATGSAIKTFINHLLSPLIQSNKKVHILVGNHERNIGGDVFNFIKEIEHPNIFIYDSVKHYNFGDYMGIFVPFLYPGDFDVTTISKLEKEAEKCIKELSEKVKKENPDKPLVLFNHNIMTDGLPFDNGREVNIKLMELNAIDFVFGGHIHKHEVFGNKGMYIGSFMKSFVYEEESEGYVEFFVKNGKVEHKRVELSSYNYEKLYIENIESFFDTVEIKANTVYDFVIYIDLGIDSSLFISDLTRKVTELGSFIKNKKIETKIVEGNVTGISNIFTTEEEILKDYLSENKIKDKATKQRFFDKLDICKSMSKILHQADIDKKVEKNFENNIKRSNDFSGIIRKDRRLITE